MIGTSYDSKVEELPMKRQRVGDRDMASIKDVANLAGVGLGTASRALSGKGYVAPETKRRIEEAARKLSYTPNVFAQNLLKNKSGIIAILVPALDHCFFSRLVQELESDLYKKGYKTMVCCTSSGGHEEEDYLDMLENNLVDGIITATHSFNDEAYLGSNRVVVSFDRDFGGHIPMVRSDHKAAGRMAAEHFIKKGCRKVLNIYGEDATEGHISVGNAHRELKVCLEAAGVQVVEEYTRQDRFNMGYYSQVAGTCLEKYRDMDGVFASDPLAEAFLWEGKRRGKRIPQKLKIISYDGTERTESISPRISAVVQQIDKISACLTDILTRRIQGEEIGEDKITEILWRQGETC